MIELLAWDSDFFGRKMGVLTGEFSSPEAIARDLTAATADGYEYLQCRPPVEIAAAVRTLERSGFYLTDLGVTWCRDVARYLSGAEPIRADSVRLAHELDVPRLVAEGAKLFRLSRFYDDPFFSVDEADRLHAAWVANSVRGLAADAVWMMPEGGFVTCKLAPDGAGEVALIGVWEQCRSRGVGRHLMTTALTWFASKGVAAVRVRTQVKNLRAMNFYHRLGFDLQRADMTMGRIMRPDATRYRERWT